MTSKRLLALIAIVFAGAFLRLAYIRLPFPGFEGGVNFAPIGALAIFAGMSFRDKRIAFGLPLLCTFLVDLILGLQNNDLRAYLFNPMMLFVYASWIAYVGVGLVVRHGWQTGADGQKKQKPSLLKGAILLGGSLTGSILFFLISNLGWWATSSLYPKSIAGLADCYVAAIPFFPPTIVGDLLYVFGLVAMTSVIGAFTIGDEPAPQLSAD